MAERDSGTVSERSERIAIRNVSKIFGPATDDALRLLGEGHGKAEVLKRTGCVVAVNDVSFSVGAGEIFVVMGLSGSGKSTLVRCLNRLQPPTSGQVLIDGEDVCSADDERLRALRLEKITMVFQHFALLPHRTVVENAEYGLKMRDLAPQARREKALKTLDSVGLAAWADRLPSDLSGGMQQRVGLARALALDPEILLMDEPFSALDPLIRQDMQKELIELQRNRRTTIIFITHDLNEALTLGDRVAVMKDGRFSQIGTPPEIVTAPADDYVAAFTRDIDRGRVLPVRAALRNGGPPVAAEGLRRVDGGRKLVEVLALAAEGPLLVIAQDGRPEGVVSAEDIAAVIAPPQGG
jgi:glycine betaine/proline transport system ATP-binding protein